MDQIDLVGKDLRGFVEHDIALGLALYLARQIFGDGALVSLQAVILARNRRCCIVFTLGADDRLFNRDDYLAGR